MKNCRATCRLYGFVSFVVVLVTGGCESRDPQPIASTSQERAMETDFIATANRAVLRGDLAGAQTSIRQHLLQYPDDSTAFELAGDIAASRGEFGESVEMYRAAVASPKTPDAPSLALMRKLSEAEMRASQPLEAVETLRKTSELYPSDVQSHYDLAGLSAVIGLPELAIPSLKWLMTHGHGDPESLVVLADTGRVKPDTEMCLELMKRMPTDRRLEFCLAQQDAAEMDWQSAADRLEKVVRDYPQFLAAYAWYGLALAKSGNYDKLPGWVEASPASVKTYPEYWIARGLLAQSETHFEAAARSFFEAIRRDETRYPETLSYLLSSLKSLDRDREAEVVADQIVRYSKLRDALAIHFERKSQSQESALNVAEAMVAMGRLWEAEGWASLATKLPNDLRSGYP